MSIINTLYYGINPLPVADTLKSNNLEKLIENINFIEKNRQYINYHRRGHQILCKSENDTETKSSNSENADVPFCFATSDVIQIQKFNKWSTSYEYKETFINETLMILLFQFVIERLVY